MMTIVKRRPPNAWPDFKVAPNRVQRAYFVATHPDDCGMERVFGIAGRPVQTSNLPDFDASRPYCGTLRLTLYRPCSLPALLQGLFAARNLRWLCPVGDASSAFSATVAAVWPSVEPNARACPDSPTQGDRHSTVGAQVAVQYHAGR